MGGSASQSGAADGSHLLLTLTNDRDGFDETRLAVLRLLAPHDPSAQLLFNVELILEESLMNVIWHAFPDKEAHPITLNVRVEAEDIVMRFEDDGIAFDPLLAPAPTPPTSIDKAVPGGLGLMLVRKFARSVAYERHAGRNCLTVRVARS
ncbi:MAG: ATP-binding protein [Burkholderiaceae bacterium]|nr:ATP-binding protein [Burkholderiaceae bacterium]